MAKLNQPQKKQEINFRTFDELIEFYNKYESFFLEFYHQTGFNLWFLIHFRLYFQYRNIQLDSLESKSNTDKSERTDKKPFFEKVVKTIRLLREVLFILFKLKKPKSYKGKKVLLSNTSDMIKGKNKRFASMDDEFEFILNRPLFDIKQSLKNTKNRSYNLYDTDHIFMRYILKFTFVKDLKRLSIQLKSLKKNLSQAADNEEIKETTINKLIWKDVSSYYIYFMRFISFKNFFQTNKIEALLMIDENSPQQKVIQYAAKLYEIKIFAYQHGNIHLLHPAYIYKRYSTKPLLPFTTFTWGKHFTNMLKDEGGYLDEQLKTVGRIDAETNRPKSHPELENMSNIVLYASQKQRDEELRKRQLRDVIYALKENENKYSLIIRPHPTEKDDNYFIETAEELNFKNLIIDRKTDLKSHMELCSLLIVSFSTVGTEFIPYYKPLIVLDYLDQDLISWIKQGVGIQIRSGDELKKLLSKGDLNINKEAYDKFIENYFYKRDGKAALRIKEYIEKQTNP